MGLLDFINNRIDSTKVIGQIECADENQAAQVFINMLSSMGMTNPGTTVNSSTKGIVIKKKGTSYVITLNMYNPPIIFTWTGLMPDSQLAQVITRLADDNKKVGSINRVKMSDGNSLFQLGIAS